MTDTLTACARAIRKIRCVFGYHWQLDVIQSYGSAQHVGCPDCGKEMGIHHGMRAVLPWDADLAQMYRDFGYDVDAATDRWQAHRTAMIRAAVGEK